MDVKEMGKQRGYWGIWNDIGGLNKPTKEKVFKYERVFGWGEDEPYCYDSLEVKEKKAKNRKANYFIHGGALYKLVHEDGELFSWMNGVDPLKK